MTGDPNFERVGKSSKINYHDFFDSIVAFMIKCQGTDIVDAAILYIARKVFEEIKTGSDTPDEGTLEDEEPLDLAALRASLNVTPPPDEDEHVPQHVLGTALILNAS